jgi:hypothetical protein
VAIEFIKMATDNYQNYIKHLESIIQMHENATKAPNGWVYSADAYGILARAESAIRKICSDGSPYRERMDEILKTAFTDEPVKAGLIVGIVKALKGELEVGYLPSFPELVRGEMFEDLNEMAKHLVQEGYKDAAAVIAGTSLESHLHQLSIKNSVSIDYTGKDGSTKKKTAERLNQELGKNVYSLFEQKQITAWLDLRNNAAHGNYSEYDQDQVAKLIEWVGDFISKNPA